MLSIIYPYRNRDIQRLRNSFESLKEQSYSQFEVVLVDYGSDFDMSLQVRSLCQEFEFISYEYRFTRYQPWNKSRALNSVIRKMDSDFCFVADIDMVFHPEFIEVGLQLRDLKKVIYFQVGFLNKGESRDIHELWNDRKIRKSSAEATGLTLFPVKELQKLRGFDEFYHFWGAEDTDIHVRLRNAGIEVNYYDQRLLLLHQWHSSYRSREKASLTKELQITGIVQVNHQHLLQANSNKRTVVNSEEWGKCPGEEEMRALESAETGYTLTPEKKIIDEFLYAHLPTIRNETVKVRIIQDPFLNSLKYRTKKMIGKKVPEYYSLKEVNDKLLLHLIAFYREEPYYYKVDADLEGLEMAIKL